MHAYHSRMLLSSFSGEVRVFNYVTGSLTLTLRGHRSAVTSVAFDEDPASAGSILATGGADCDVILWDLLAQTAVARFHEHKDAVTALAFVNLPAQSQKLLLSASKDALVKVWDTDTRHCVQTIVGHRSEVWALTVLHDDERVRVFTAAADEMIRGYRFSTDTTNDNKDITVDNTQEIFSYYGCVKRTAGLDRCLSLAINPAKNVLAAQSAGKTVEVSGSIPLCIALENVVSNGLVTSYSSLRFATQQRLRRS
jgi:U3 small nucleolar RNA-associated protein 12